MKGFLFAGTMKIFLTKIVTTVCFLCMGCLYSQNLEIQENYPQTGDSARIYTERDVTDPVRYKGGFKAFKRFAAFNLDYPQEAMNQQIHGKVILFFVVEINGTLSDIRVIKGLGGGCTEEAVRFINRTQGRWLSAKLDGVPVRSYFKFPIIFRLPE